MKNILNTLTYRKIAVWFALAIVFLMFYRFGFGISASMDYCIDGIEPADINAFPSVKAQIIIVIISVIFYEILIKLLNLIKANAAITVISVFLFIFAYGIFIAAPIGGRYQLHHSRKIMNERA